MASMIDHLNKCREERAAREKARIEKLRELNLKKYVKNEIDGQPKKNPNLSRRPSSSSSMTCPSAATVSTSGISKQIPKDRTTLVPKQDIKLNKSEATFAKIDKDINNLKKNNVGNAKSCNFIKNNVSAIRKPELIAKCQAKRLTIQRPEERKVEAKNSRQSIVSKIPQSNGRRESVFERLYKPKVVAKATTINIKPISETNLVNGKKRCTMVPNQRPVINVVPLVRRSISAVHFKRIAKTELANCIQKYSSMSSNLNKIPLMELNEEGMSMKQDIVFAVKSDKKKVKFQTPTPRPVELQERLNDWLKKRGKSVDSYQHLQCFGLHHMSKGRMTPIRMNFNDELYSCDEDKENIAVDIDSESLTEMVGTQSFTPKWRTASVLSEDLNDTPETGISSEPESNIDELILGALSNLTELLKEGYSWEQCASWLGAIRERFPSAIETAAYWECRAALEETRGDLTASVECWNEAIAKGTAKAVVDANLDKLLDNFMQLKISPNSGKKPANSKMVDVKNVFKSTIIRFAVQQAKLRQSNQQTPAKYTATPVRRSSRLSAHWSAKRTPLQVCDSLKHINLPRETLVFVPNEHLPKSP